VGASFYFDEDFAHDDRVDAARRVSLDLLVPSEAGMLGKQDIEQLRFARSLGRIIVTHNQAHFDVLHRRFLEAGERHSGICILRMEAWLGPGEIARRLTLLSERFGAEGMVNDLRYLSQIH
jgi:hypothetical protein